MDPHRITLLALHGIRAFRPCFAALASPRRLLKLSGPVPLSCSQFEGLIKRPNSGHGMAANLGNWNSTSCRVEGQEGVQAAQAVLIA